MSRAVSTRRRRRLSVDGLGIVNGRSVVVDQFRSSHAQHTGRSCKAAQKKTSKTTWG
ncbi:MAG: hypothetical protein U0835_01765 [Isosphaeraceae bacterium]